jgi:hypothetical protein
MIDNQDRMLLVEYVVVVIRSMFFMNVLTRIELWKTYQQMIDDIVDKHAMQSKLGVTVKLWFTRGLF